MSYLFSKLNSFFSSSLDFSEEDSFEDLMLTENKDQKTNLNNIEHSDESKMIGVALTFYQIESAIKNLKYNFSFDQVAFIEFSGVNNQLINPSYGLFSDINISNSYIIMVSYTNSNSIFDSISFCNGHSILLKVDSGIEIIDPKGPLFSVSKDFIYKVFNNINLFDIKGNAKKVLSDIKNRLDRINYISWSDFYLYVNSEGSQPLFFNHTCSRRCIMFINNILNHNKKINLKDIDIFIKGENFKNRDIQSLFYSPKNIYGNDLFLDELDK